MPNLYEDAEKATAYIENLRAERKVLQQATASLQDNVTLQSQQIKALSERMDFNEDCMAEMAAQVYTV